VSFINIQCFERPVRYTLSYNFRTFRASM
jgi:hypothetical protein